jgi:hypothetical protein
MLDEITEKYKIQFGLYSNIYEALRNFDKQNIDATLYNKELENIDFILEKIKKNNNGAEQLKQIYILKNNLNDFTGSELRKIEKEDKYNEFKIVIDNLTDKVISVKKLQDKIINIINNEVNITKQMLREINNTKKVNPSFNFPIKNQHSAYIDKKK